MTTNFSFNGFYNYNTGKQPHDDGFMHFPLTCNNASYTVQGSGKDYWGAFTISGFYDGINLRFFKKYADSNEQVAWKYVGERVDHENEGAIQGQRLQQFVGNWGKGPTPYGQFVFSAVEILEADTSISQLLPGTWRGHYFYSSSPAKRNPCMTFALETNANHITGRGNDGIGPFAMSGEISGNSIIMFKSYSTWSWRYAGQFQTVEGGKPKIEGTWGSQGGGDELGTFVFEKSEDSAGDRKAPMPAFANKICGELTGELAEKVASEAEVVLGKDSVSDLIEGFGDISKP